MLEGLGHGAVEHHVRAHAGEHGAEVGAGRGGTAAPSSCVARTLEVEVEVEVEVDEPDGLAVGGVAQCVEPQAADAAAADLQHSESFVHGVRHGAAVRAVHGLS